MTVMCAMLLHTAGVVDATASTRTAVTMTAPARVVPIRIHDYAGLDVRHLKQAQRQVSAVYRQLGIQLDWHSILRPWDLAPQAPPTAIASPSAVTIVVLAPDMAETLKVPPGVTGFAALTRARGDRVAYVVSERARDIAKRDHLPLSSVVARVVAQELAHLLVPRGPRSPRAL